MLADGADTVVATTAEIADGAAMAIELIDPTTATIARTTRGTTAIVRITTGRISTATTRTATTTVGRAFTSASKCCGSCSKLQHRKASNRCRAGEYLPFF